MASTQKTDITYTKTNIKAGRGGIVASLTTALDDIRDDVRLGLAGVSGDATHIGTLEDVLLGGTSISMSTQNGGGNETRTITLDSADGIDITATAGEALNVRDMVYLDETDGEWYQQDSDATSPIKMGRLRGCVTESGGIAENAQGTVRILGVVSGFTSLTAGGSIYASTTAGSYTQTKPFASMSGTQIAVSEMGYATSTTAMWIEPAPVTYRKRGDVAYQGTLTIEHHADAEHYERDVNVLLRDASPGSTLTSHADTEQDAQHPIQGPTDAGAGGENFDNTGGATSASVFIGTFSGDTYEAAGEIENFGHGTLVTLGFRLGASGGSPTGTITWEIQGASGGPDGTVYATGTFTPTASSVNYIDIDSDIFLDSQNYYFVLKPTSAQTDGNYWTWRRGDAAGEGYYRRINGSWSVGGTESLLMNVVAIDSADKTKLAQSFQIGSSTSVGKVRLYLRKKGTPAGDLTVKIVNDDTGSPDETPSLESTSLTVSASNLTTSWAWYDFEFDSPPSLTSATTYWIVLETTDSQSDTNYVSWAFEYDSPGYANGSFQQYEGSWAETTAGDAIFDVVEADDVIYSQMLIDDWGSTLATILARYDDGSGNNRLTKTTVKNETGSEETLELAVTL